MHGATMKFINTATSKVVSVFILIFQAVFLRQILNCTITEKLKCWEEKIILTPKKQNY